MRLWLPILGACIGLLTDGAVGAQPRLFTVGSDGLIELNEALDIVAEYPIPGLTGATGITANQNGNLVFIGFHDGRTKVLETTTNGSIVSSFDPGSGALLSGSYIDYDPIDDRYVFADHRRVVIIDSNLEFVAATDRVLGRASGVGFRDDGAVYAVDIENRDLSVFSPDLSSRTVFPIGGRVNSGIHVEPDGQVLISSFGEGTVRRWDPATTMSTTLISGFSFGDISDVLALPIDDILVMGNNGPLYRYDANGMLLDQSDALPGSPDGIAYLVPNSGVLVAIVLTVLGNRERRAA